MHVATLLTFGYLDVGMHLNKEKGTVLKQTTKFHLKSHFMELKMYIIINENIWQPYVESSISAKS